jgi:hypothetical protein
MNYKTTEWFKFFDIDEEGKLLSPTAWKVTLKNGMVYKSSNWSKKYEDNETQHTVGCGKTSQS